MCVSQEILAHTNRERQRVPRQSEAESVGDRWDGEADFLYFKDGIFYLFLPAWRFPTFYQSLHVVQAGQSFTSCSCWEDWCMFTAHKATGEGTHRQKKYIHVVFHMHKYNHRHRFATLHSSSELPDWGKNGGWKHGWVTSSTWVKSLSHSYSMNDTYK